MPASNFLLTHPASLAAEIDTLAGGAYYPDVDGDREGDGLLRQLYRMLEARFRVAGHLLRHQPWDLFMMVEVATVRLQQAVCDHADLVSPLNMKDGLHEQVVADFCECVDARTGSLIAQLCDETTVVVVSAYGAHSAVAAEGIFIVTRLSDLRRGVIRGRRIEEASVLDLTPTMLHEFGLTVPSGVGGKIITVEEPDNRQVVLAGGCGGGGGGGRAGASRACSPEEGDLIRKRLGRLGYL